MSNTTTSTKALEPQGSTLAVSSNQVFWSAQQLAALRQIGVQDAPNADLAVFLNFAQRTGLDPFARQIYMIGRNSQGGKKWTIQASIDGLRIVAERSGDYAGQVGPEYCGHDGVWRDTWTDVKPPVAARIGVLRNGFAAPLYAVAYWDEYVQADREGRPTQMWASKPRLMLAKCAEALALRKAFPNDLAGLYTADEMGNADVQRVVVNPMPAAVEAAPAPQVDVVTPDEVIAVEVIEATGEIVEPVAETPSTVATDAQRKLVNTLLTKLGYTDTEARRQQVHWHTNGAATHIDELSKRTASKLIDDLQALIANQQGGGK